MPRLIVFLFSVSLAGAGTAAPAHDASWTEKSNTYTNLLLEVQLKHSPEQGSQEGVAKFDTLIANPRNSTIFCRVKVCCRLI
jgi:hypothetical protein